MPLTPPANQTLRETLEEKSSGSLAVYRDRMLAGAAIARSNGDAAGAEALEDCAATAMAVLKARDDA
jgi:hypothetical protein